MASHDRAHDVAYSAEAASSSTDCQHIQSDGHVSLARPPCINPVRLLEDESDCLQTCLPSGLTDFDHPDYEATMPSSHSDAYLSSSSILPSRSHSTIACNRPSSSKEVEPEDLQQPWNEASLRPSESLNVSGEQLISHMTRVELIVNLKCKALDLSHSGPQHPVSTNEPMHRTATNYTFGDLVKFARKL